MCNTSMLRTAALAALALVAAGCAGRRPELPAQAISIGHAQLIPGSVSVSIWGQDYKVHGIVELRQGQRVGLETFASDCIRGIGTVNSAGFTTLDPYIGRPSGWLSFPNAIAAAGTPLDVIFKGICDQGIPLVEELATSESPEERAEAKEFFRRMKWQAAKRQP